MDRSFLLHILQRWLECSYHSQLKNRTLGERGIRKRLLLLMCHFFLFGEMRIHTRTRKIDNLCTTFFTLLIIFLSFLSNKVVVATSSFKNKNNTPHIINKLTFSNTYTYIPKSGIAFHHSSCAFENRTAHDKKEKLSGKTIKRLSSI